MRILLVFSCLFLSQSIFFAQDQLKIQFDGNEAFHFRKNANGSHMIDVYENNTFLGRGAGEANGVLCR
ncbi:MAG: hypothetical protein P1U56_17765 [Saprospiraceae bacterium]|nr:hypothetical protein [Saprospiraceae bacterium]